MEVNYLNVGSLCSKSPVATAVVESGNIVYVNDSLLRLFGAKDKSLFLSQDWIAKLVPTGKQLLIQNLFSGDKLQVSLELFTESGANLYVRLFRNEQVIDGNFVVVFQDLTVLHENSEAFKASYDEFINVTIELENALKLIQQQKSALQKQHDIISNELQIAHRLQDQLYREDFRRYKSFNIYGYYQSMASLGGDMWEILESDGTLFVVLGDVMGHGVASSLISITAKTLFKKEFQRCAKEGTSLGEAMQKVNTELLGITKSKYFITVAVIRLDKDLTMEYATAGHPPILCVSPLGETSQYSTGFPMLGLFRDVEYGSDKIQLPKESRLLLYTDCLIENGEDIEKALPTKILADILVETKREKSLAKVLETIAEVRELHTGSPELPDDLAMIAVDAKETESPDS